jgi:hypothetical protein
MRIAPQSTSRRGHRQWHRESVDYGHKLGRLMRQGENKPRVTNLSGLLPYYLKRFNGNIGDFLKEQIEWAVNKWPNVFSDLLKHDILPLDITACERGVVTSVELLRDVVGFDRLDPAKVAKTIFMETGYLIQNQSGARLIRGEEYYLELFDQRPELKPIAAPSDAAQMLVLGERARYDAGKELERRQDKNRSWPLKFISPGVYCPFSSRVVHLHSAKQLFHRQCWIEVTDPIQAIEYLLRGEEMSNELRNNPHESMYTIIKKINHQMDIETYLKQMMCAWGGDGWYSLQKPFVSVTTRPDILPGIRVKGNLFIRVMTHRAMQMTTTPILRMEDEWFVPFIINPAEIKAAGFRHNWVHTDLIFNWSKDFRNLEVEVKQSCFKWEEDQLSSIHYYFDPAVRRYRETATNSRNLVRPDSISSTL